MGVFPDRSLNASYRYSHINASEAAYFNDTNTFAQLFVMVSMVFFLRCLWLLRAALKRVSKNAEPKKKILRACTGGIICAFLADAWTLVFTSVWDVDPTACSFAGGAGGV
jgi:hypothetical protein